MEDEAECQAIMEDECSSSSRRGSRRASLVWDGNDVVVVGRPVAEETAALQPQVVPPGDAFETLVSIDRAVLYGRLLRYVSNIQILCVFDMITSFLWLLSYEHRLIALKAFLPLLGIVGTRLRNPTILFSFTFYLTAAIALHLGFFISDGLWPLIFWILLYVYLMFLTYKLLRVIRELTPAELATIREAHFTLRRVRIV
ncbi:hypothetical protein FOL47_000555 [Perkinsus chesapeaki]|uniref:Uncharacterized protein n=1 Tax=Perkinsus chesapeaki TaxID=330153 RepID=A0A7J6N2D5_PERCH|nr:hypothetical protein FOL47_000555 [Perkinsus chesapeaki]